MTAHSSKLREWFDGYLNAFNNADYDGFGAYYAEDVLFIGQAAQVQGRSSVLEFYRKVRTYLDERVDTLSFVGAPDGSAIVAELRTSLVAHRDWPDMPTGPMLAGDKRESINIAFYDILDGQFTRVRTARLWPQPQARS